MNRKNLEITLSASVNGFTNPKVILEQYSTPPRVAANMIYRAFELGDIQAKKVIDFCTGTGILAIGCALLGATVSAIEIDEEVMNVLNENIMQNHVNIKVINHNIFTFEWKERYDTVVQNPPFGIQQKKYKDTDFIIKAHEVAKTVYSIVDGSPNNLENIKTKIAKHGIIIEEAYFDEFPIKKQFSWHKAKEKVHRVLILKSLKI